MWRLNNYKGKKNRVTLFKISWCLYIESGAIIRSQRQVLVIIKLSHDSVGVAVIFSYLLREPILGSIKVI